MSEPISYEGFLYSYVSEGKWRITTPASVQSLVCADSEDDLKAKIDAYIASLAE